MVKNLKWGIVASENRQKVEVKNERGKNNEKA